MCSVPPRMPMLNHYCENKRHHHRRTLRVCKRVLLILTATALLNPVAWAAGERSPSVAEIEALFRVLTRELPHQFRLAAEVELVDPPASESEVQTMLRQQEEMMRKYDQLSTRTERDALRDARLRGLRQWASGRRRYLQREWYSGALYRLDQTDLSIQPPTGQQNTPEVYTDTFINIDDPSFASYSSVWVTHPLRSATLDERPVSKWQRADLWQAYVAEPQYAFLFVLATADRQSVASLAANTYQASFAGADFDSARALALAEGKIPGMRLLVEEIRGEATPLTCLRLTSSNATSGSEVVINYCLDTDTLSRLVHLEVLENGQSRYSATTDEYDESGFPHYWRTERVDEQGKLHVRTVRFTEVSLSVAFDDHEVFGAHFPTNYMVGLWNKAGEYSLLQNPGNVKVLDASILAPVPSWRRAAMLAALVVFLCVPGAFICFRRRVKYRERPFV